MIGLTPASCNAAGCREQCFSWRSCGAGCQLLAAYCVLHGGDLRARSDMRQHMLGSHRDAALTTEVHAYLSIDGDVPHDDDPFCPRHGRASRPSEIPGLRCDCNRTAMDPDCADALEWE